MPPEPEPAAGPSTRRLQLAAAPRGPMPEVPGRAVGAPPAALRLVAPAPSRVADVAPADNGGGEATDADLRANAQRAHDVSGIEHRVIEPGYLAGRGTPSGWRRLLLHDCLWAAQHVAHQSGAVVLAACHDARRAVARGRRGRRAR